MEGVGVGGVGGVGGSIEKLASFKCWQVFWQHRGLVRADFSSEAPSCLIYCEGYQAAFRVAEESQL